jgi:hypothetical protein
MNALLAEYVGETSSISGDNDKSLLEVAHHIPVLASALASRKMVSSMMTTNEAMRASLEQRIKQALGPAMPPI